VTCAPVYSSRDGLSTQVPIGPEEGLKHECAIHCDELVSIPKERLSDYVGALSPDKLAQLGTALKIALAVED
jgi:mRNA interferase MazF